MTPRIVTVPRALVVATRTDWDIDWREVSAGTSLDGADYAVISAMPRWIGAPELILNPAQARQWRAIRWAGRGRTGVFRIPMVDRAGAHLGSFAQVPFDGPVTFDDGTGFDGGPKVPCPDGAAAGATEIVVDESQLEVPIPVGQIMSRDDWPMGVIWREAEGPLTRLGIEMPLRKAIPEGAMIAVAGTGLFRLGDPRAGNVDTAIDRWTRIRLDLQEWLR